MTETWTYLFTFTFEEDFPKNKNLLWKTGVQILVHYTLIREIITQKTDAVPLKTKNIKLANRKQSFVLKTTKFYQKNKLRSLVSPRNIGFYI